MNLFDYIKNIRPNLSAKIIKSVVTYVESNTFYFQFSYGPQPEEHTPFTPVKHLNAQTRDANRPKESEQAGFIFESFSEQQKEELYRIARNGMRNSPLV
jgi:hypothetical protein